MVIMERFLFLYLLSYMACFLGNAVGFLIVHKDFDWVTTKRFFAAMTLLCFVWPIHMAAIWIVGLCDLINFIRYGKSNG
jgi:hypothetical protein